MENFDLILKNEYQRKVVTQCIEYVVAFIGLGDGFDELIADLLGMEAPDLVRLLKEVDQQNELSIPFNG